MTEFNISIKQPVDDSFGKSLISLLSFLQELYPIQSGDKLIVCLDSISFVYPFFILPIASQINKLKEQGIDVEIKFEQSGSKEYLQTIKFPFGLSPIIDENWKLKLVQFQQKTYVPISLFPSGEENAIEREHIISTLETIISEKVKLNSAFRSSLSLLIAEASDNIINHACVDFGWIILQVYPQKGFIDLCICDSGITVLGSYLKHGKYRIVDDKEALNAAINGMSTKDYAIKRGYGISKSISLLVDGLGGKYFIFSGLAAYVNTIDFKQIISFREDQKFYGTMVAMRIPLTIHEGFNLYKYIE